jgi:hypothetical protein
MRYIKNISVDLKTVIILLLLVVITWSNLEKTISIEKEESNFQLDIDRINSTRAGDEASMCAAIYSSIEKSWTGIFQESLVFWNFKDMDEDKIESLVRMFYTVAMQHYKNSGESDESAKLLADHTIISNIHFINGLEITGDGPNACKEIIKTIDKDTKELREEG